MSAMSMQSPKTYVGCIASHYCLFSLLHFATWFDYHMGEMRRKGSSFNKLSEMLKEIIIN
eukprot:3915939-Amphidinium_carterae.1